MQAVGSKQIDKVRGSEIQIDVLEAQQYGEQKTRCQESLSILGVDQGKDKNSI